MSWRVRLGSQSVGRMVGGTARRRRRRGMWDQQITTPFLESLLNFDRRHHRRHSIPFLAPKSFSRRGAGNLSVGRTALAKGRGRSRRSVHRAADKRTQWRRRERKRDHSLSAIQPPRRSSRPLSAPDLFKFARARNQSAQGAVIERGREGLFCIPLRRRCGIQQQATERA